MYSPEAIQQFLVLLPTLGQSSLGILSGFADIVGGAVPLVIGILIIVLVVGLAIILLPAFLIGLVVWFLTGSFFLAGISFLVVAAISLVKLI